MLKLQNPHNSISRSAIIESLEAEPTLRHLAWHFATTMAMTTGLETGGKLWGEAEDGLVQGDPESGGYFCVGWHREVKELDTELAVEGGCCIFGNDDGYLLGPPDAVFAALENFSRNIQHCGLVLQREKTELFAWGELPPNTPADLKRAGVMINGVFAPGMECYGVGIGSPAYISNYLGGIVEEITEVVNKTCNLLEEDLQAKWTLLTASVSQKLSYSLSLQYPSDIREAARQLDTVLWEMMQKATGLHIPRVEEGRGVECALDVPVQGLVDQSFQSWLVRLPVREKGMGLRSLVDTIPAAFIGSVEMSLPFFGGREGLCRLLEPITGDILTVDTASRWNTLLTSGCWTGREFSNCWDLLHGEATQCSVYMGEELVGELATTVEGVGDGRVDGSTRRLVTQQRESLRARVLYRALSLHPDQTARPVWAFPQYDKMSCAWLLATPSPDTYIPGPLFREAMATHLCLPSPCCRSHVGKPTGYRNELVDAFGDNVMCATLPFDTWRNRHNDVQRGLVARANEARVEVEAEVFGLFRDIIPAAVLGEGGGLETVRDRMGCVPDLRLGFPVSLADRRPDYHPRRGRPPLDATLPAPQPAHPAPRPAQWPPTRYLAELKIMSAGPSRYPRGEAGSRSKQVDRRARGLPADYKKKLAVIDTQYYHTARV